MFQKLYDLYIEECEKEPEIKVSGNCQEAFHFCLNRQVWEILFLLHLISLLKKTKLWLL